MTDDQQLTLWVGATRYHLGRMTYAVQNFCELLRQEWAQLPEPTRKIIRRDVDEAFRHDDEMRASVTTHFRPLGMDCDRAEWEMVRKLWTDVPEIGFGNMAGGLTIPRSAGG